MTPRNRYARFLFSHIEPSQRDEHAPFVFAMVDEVDRLIQIRRKCAESERKVKIYTEYLIEISQKKENQKP